MMFTWKWTQKPSQENCLREKETQEDRKYALENVEV